MKQTENSLEFFVLFIFPIVILVLGLFGNVMGMFLLTISKRLAQIGPVNTYRYLLLVDCVTLLMVISNNYFVNGFSTGFSLLNDSACKLYKYAVHVTASLSKFCLLYVLIERYLAIKFPVESNHLRKPTYQLAYFLVVTLVDCVYFVPVLFYFNIQHQTFNDSSTTPLAFCDPMPDKKLAMQCFIFASEVIIPAVLLIVFTIILIYTIHESKSQMSTFYTPRENEIFKKDVHLSIVAIVMSFLLVVAYVPGLIFTYSSMEVPSYVVLLCLYFFLAIRTFKLYFFLAFNTLFWEAFMSVVRKLRKKPHAQTNEEIEML